MISYIQSGLDALERGRRFVTHDIWYIGRPGEQIPHGLIIKQVRVVILLMQNLLQGALLLRAAALTFTTTLSIVPFLAIIFFVIQQLNLGADISSFVLSMVEDSRVQTEETNAPKALPVTPASQAADVLTVTPSGPSDAKTVDPNEQVAAMLLEWVFPELKRDVPDPKDVDPVAWIAARAKESVDFRKMGTLGLLFVFATVFGLMWNIESAFNAIWGLKATRSWYRIFSDYMMVVLLLPFLVAGVLSVTAVLTSGPIAERLGVLAYGLRGIQYIVIWVAFAVLYAMVPNTKVMWRYALLGGVVAGTLWCLTSWAYVELQIGVSRNSLVYSSFVLFPLLLMWIHISWIILLFGAELTFAYQNEKTFAMERHAAGASHAYREAVGLRAMVEVCRRFDSGESGLAVADAAQEWNVPTRLINQTLDLLEEVGLVRRCSTEPVTYAPARSIHKITIGDVVHSLRESGREPSALRQDDLLRPLLEEVSAAEAPPLRANMADLIQRFNPPLPLIALEDEEPPQELEDQSGDMQRAE
ncbi:MAG: YihY/virulence factor BrkB family protein [Candidatus Hydrogenedentales bacterium]|jgi:membrane protein